MDSWISLALGPIDVLSQTFLTFEGLHSIIKIFCSVMFVNCNGSYSGKTTSKVNSNVI